MPCYHPLAAWYSRRKNESGKRGITFRMSEGLPHRLRPVEVPCGTCIGCKLERSRQWAMRCLHESKEHEVSSFVTLTYDDEHLAANGSLVPEHYQLFMKRLRKAVGPVRFFQAGEYGEALGRPHHHAILFGYWPSDCRFYKVGESGEKLYSSAELERLWGQGLCSVGHVSFESAAYIARYTLKKVVGSGADAWYGSRIPEFLTMSRRPGIGHGFAIRYREEIYRGDSCVVRGAECKPPRYYDSLEERFAPSVLGKIKARRRRAAADSVDNSGKRLVVREAVKTAAIGFLRRT